MKKLHCFSWITVCLLILLSGSLMTGFAQESKIKLLNDMAGEYEITMDDGRVQTVKFFIKDGFLYLTQEGSPREPGKLESVTGKELDFTLEHPDRGTYRIQFSKNEQGEISRCLVTLELYGLDFTGIKKKPDMKKTYAKILGNWEFDIENYGPLVFNIYEKEGVLWIVPKRGQEEEPNKLQKIEGKEWEFIANSPHGAQFIFNFLKTAVEKSQKAT